MYGGYAGRWFCFLRVSLLGCLFTVDDKWHVKQIKLDKLRARPPPHAEVSLKSEQDWQSNMIFPDRLAGEQKLDVDTASTSSSDR